MRPFETPHGKAGQMVLDLVLNYFRHANEWPDFDLIDRALYAQEVKSEDAFQDLPEGLLIGPDRNRYGHLPLPETLLELTLMGAINCSNDSARPEVDGAVLLTRLAAEVDKGWMPTAERREPVLNEAGALLLLREEESLWPRSIVAYAAKWDEEKPRSFLDHPFEKRSRRAQVLLRSAKLLTREPAFKGSGFHDDYGWELRFGREVRPFFGVADPREYWRHRSSLIIKGNLGAAPMQAAAEPASSVTPADMPATKWADPGWSVECALHPEVVEAAAARYESGHLADAVQKAFQAVEDRVQRLTASSEIGARLMGTAFGGQAPKLEVARADGVSRVSEQEGFRELFRGAMSGLRNPRAHGPHYAEEEAEVGEMLAFASLLMRRLDLAEQRLGTVVEEASVE
ncbi:TIGR02391 family protein [Streptomyces cinereoruber]|uniref:TIGR02391 family protein n=1 Tax=Streptomyces cinereoruber TaxID=67260 RepID=UPI003C2E6627